MLNLDTTDVLEGIASVDAVIKFTVSGHDATNGVISKEGTVANTNTELYTAVGATRIYSVTFYNSHSAAVTITLNKDPANAGTLYPLFSISLGIGYSLVFDGARCSVFDASGNLQTGAAGSSTTIASDTIWAAAGDLVQGTGNDAAAVLPLGAAMQKPRVNAGATAIEWANETGITTKTTTATLTLAEAGIVLVSAAAAYTITLPTAVGNTGLAYHFKKTDANYNLITLDGNGTETFNYENSTGTPNLTYPRLNTYCAEVTVVSDGSNWQVIDEALGQVPTAYVYLSVKQEDILNSLTTCIEFDTEVFDIGSNFDISTWVSGNATSTSANHLVDTGGAFTADMLRKRVKNTTDTTYTYITAVNSATDITLRDDIFVDTEGYEIKHSEFVVPVTGIYEVKAQASFYYGTVVANKRYNIAIYNNHADISNFTLHSSNTDGLDVGIVKSFAFTKDDIIEARALNTSGLETVDLSGGAEKFTFMQIRLISKD